MDLTSSIIPKSDQLNADDLIAHPVTVTVKDVTQGTAEQPVNVNLVEYPGRPYKPSKSMRRVMVAAWGADTKNYAGRRLTLYRNPLIKFGGEAVGGIEISHASDIDKPVTIALTVSRGKRKDFTIKPLETTAQSRSTDRVLVDEWISVINEASTIAQLEAAWRGAIGADVAREPDIIAAKDKRKTELS